MNLLGRNVVFMGSAFVLAALIACSKSADDGSESGDNAITGTSCQILNVKTGPPDDDRGAREAR